MARRGERYAVQDRLFAALERLESKDTQHAAVQELQRLIRELEPHVLSTLLHAAGTQTAKTSQFSRRHCLALAAQACTSHACPHWRAMLEPPLLGKLLGLLGRALRDGDAAVRTAAAEGLGTVAAQLAAAHPGSDATAGTACNPLLGCILEALGEPGAGVQASAGAALAQAADHLGALDPPLLRLLLTALNNPLCGGRAELCGALARLEAGRVHGLVGTSFQLVLAAWPDVLGSAAEGSGLLGLLGSKGKDFGARAAAAGALKALAAGVGPQAPGWDAVAAALKSAKTDISKPVRDAAAGALPLVAGLLEFAASGALMDRWPTVCGSLLAAEAGGGKQRGATGSRAKGPAAGLVEEGVLSSQLIPAVHPTTMAPSAAAGSPHGAAPLTGPVPAQATLPFVSPMALPAPTHPSLVIAPPPPLAVPMFFAPTATTAPSAVPQDSSKLAAQLACIQQQHAAMAAALAAFTSATQSTLQQLQLHLSSVGAGVAALAAGSGSSSQAQAFQAVLASVNAGMALAAGMGGAQQALASMGAGGATVPAGGQGASACCPPAAAMAASPCAPAAGCPARLSSLHRSYNALERDLLVRQQQAAFLPSSPTAAPALPSAIPPSAGRDLEAPEVCTAPPAPDWEAAYSQLLGASGGGAADQQAQLKLLRCIARSGPVWEQLSPATGQRLMQAVAAFLQEGTALKRLLPLLWPLADSAAPASRAVAAYPAVLWQQLLAALAAYPLPPAGQQQGEAQGHGSGVVPEGVSPAADPLAEKRELLLSALRAVWE